jgi:hypothetical protein
MAPPAGSALVPASLRVCRAHCARADSVRARVQPTRGSWLVRPQSCLYVTSAQDLQDLQDLKASVPESKPVRLDATPSPRARGWSVVQPSAQGGGLRFIRLCLSKLKFKSCRAVSVPPSRRALVLVLRRLLCARSLHFLSRATCFVLAPGFARASASASTRAVAPVTDFVHLRLRHPGTPVDQTIHV